MRYSQLFTQTLRELPADAELVSHRLALRAGLIRPLAAGIFSYLPLGLRVKQKIEAIFREEMAAIGCTELLMPIVQPAELWQESGRWDEIGPEMLRMADRAEREMCLAMTHEEVVTDLVRHLIQSYRQVPLSVFQIQTKFRDEPRSRGGLVRVREFTMKDAYSFHLDEASLDETYNNMYRAYENIFARVGLGESVIVVESDTGIMGGTGAHEFMYLNPAGEDTLLLCDNCDYPGQPAGCGVCKGRSGEGRSDAAGGGGDARVCDDCGSGRVFEDSRAPDGESGVYGGEGRGGRAVYLCPVAGRP